MFLEMITAVFTLAYKFISSIGPFIILLGVLIFIHELGHFMIARWCNVKVEVFSLGFGPKILKYRKGETLYCLSLIPLGGYVKMFGDNPLETIPKSQQSRGFLYKKVPQKLAIAFGGPLMNLLFTLVAFFALGIVGVSSLSSYLGDVKKDTVAYKKGFRSGDKILSINGQPVHYWKEIFQKIRDNSQKTFSFQVQNNLGRTKTLQVTTALQKNENIFESERQVGHVEGLTPLSQSSHVGIPKRSRAYRLGFRTFDEITHVNEIKVKYWRDLESIARKQKKSLTFKIKRAEQELEIKTPSLFSLKNFGLESPQLYIYKVGPRTPAAEVGLKKGDRLVSINGKRISSWEEVLKSVQSYSEGSPFRIAYKRDGRLLTSSIKPEKMIVEGQLTERFMIGIGSGLFQTFPDEIAQKFSPLQAAVYSGKQTGHWLGVITMGLVRLAQGRVSFRTMGGPVAIGRVAHTSFQKGFTSFIWIMALISLNLFFFNLLPIPLLDGGHILFFTIEGLIGRPLDTRKLLVAHQMGLLLLLSFFGLVLFNDFFNWFNSW